MVALLEILYYIQFIYKKYNSCIFAVCSQNLCDLMLLMVTSKHLKKIYYINTFNARAKIPPVPDVVGPVVVVVVLVVAAIAVVVVVGGWWHLAWCRGKALGSVNKFAVRQARLVVGWVTACSSSRPLFQYASISRGSSMVMAAVTVVVLVVGD